MPIIGMTDTCRAAFPSLGTLRKGAPIDPDSHKPGKDLAYFRFVATSPEVQAAFDAAYGPQPASLSVYLPYPTVAEAFACWHEE